MHLTIRSSRARFAASCKCYTFSPAQGRKAARLNSGVRCRLTITQLISLLALLLLVACRPAGDGPVDDRGDTTPKALLVDGFQTPSRVRYGKPSALICALKHQTAKRLWQARDQAKPHRGGYTYIDFLHDGLEYRVYLKSADLIGPSQATYVFCDGAGSPLFGYRCMLTGVSPSGCFETGIVPYSLPQIEELASKANNNYPTR